MNLIIEQGNSATKMAVFQGDRPVETAVFDTLGTAEVSAALERYPLENGIFSSVAGCEFALTSLLSKRLKRFFVFDDSLKLPLEICYRTPETLGKDRIAAAVGACAMRPKCDLLVIDAGTAITYEIVEASGRFVGGNISPGMTTRFRALNHFTRQLPLVHETDLPPLIGTSTETAIIAGVVNGIVYEMDGFIDALKVIYPDIFVFMTGGHSIYFERRLKNPIFAAINLVLTGLNNILEYNVENK
ncbi:MAG: type III pantothenate kinase [Tannerella sp.]|nr:type III pantothenate kinase [Tannerella sp.]